jgi:photosystem II stability/assembly factor-like uncharacterized protein
LSAPLREQIRQALEDEYQAPGPGFRGRLCAIPEGRADPPAAPWLPLGSSLVALFVVLALVVGASRLSGAGSAPQPAAQITAESPPAEVGWVRPVSAQEAWVVAGSDLWRTVDGGAHWTRVTPAGAGRIGLSVQAWGRDEAWVVAGSFDQLGPRSLVFHTTDGGAHWSASPSILRGHGRTPFFVDPRHGWILSGFDTGAGSESVAVYGSSDGGAGWKLLSQSGSGSLPRACPHAQIGFNDLSRGWIAAFCSSGPAGLLRTTDGGVTWQPQALPGRDGSGRLAGDLAVEPPIFFTDDDAVLAVTEAQAGVLFYSSRDGGENWGLAARMAGAVRPAVTSMRDWTVTVDGRPMVSHDAGQTWSRLQSVLEVESTVVALVNPNSGWAWRPDALYRTSDGGRSWTPISPPLAGQ